MKRDDYHEFIGKFEELNGIEHEDDLGKVYPCDHCDSLTHQVSGHCGKCGVNRQIVAVVKER